MKFFTLLYFHLLTAVIRHRAANLSWLRIKLDSGENEKLNMGRLLSRIGKKPIYRFQQEVIPCSLVLYTTLRNYAHFSTD